MPVVVHGLRSDDGRRLNGVRGVVSAPVDTRSGRCTVRLDTAAAASAGCAPEASLRPSNLRPAAAPTEPTTADVAMPPPAPHPQLAYPASPPCHADHEVNLLLYRALRAAAEEADGALLVALHAQAQPVGAPLLFQLRRAPPFHPFRSASPESQPAPAHAPIQASPVPAHGPDVARCLNLAGRTPRLELVVADSSAAATALRQSLGAAWTVALLGCGIRARTRRVRLHRCACNPPLPTPRVCNACSSRRAPAHAPGAQTSQAGTPPAAALPCLVLPPHRTA